MSDDMEIWARAIIEQNQRWLMAYLLSATGNPLVAEDLCQDVFVAALKSRDRFDSSRSFGAWLRGIAKNVLYMYYRTAEKAPMQLGDKLLSVLEGISEDEEDAQVNPEMQEEAIDTLRACMQDLGERARTLLCLKYGKHMRSKEIGERMDMKPTAVDMAISRGRKAIKTCMEQKGVVRV